MSAALKNVIMLLVLWVFARGGGGKSQFCCEMEGVFGYVVF